MCATLRLAKCYVLHPNRGVLSWKKLDLIYPYRKQFSRRNNHFQIKGIDYISFDPLTVFSRHRKLEWEMNSHCLLKWISKRVQVTTFKVLILPLKLLSFLAENLRQKKEWHIFRLENSSEPNILPFYNHLQTRAGYNNAIFLLQKHRTLYIHRHSSHWYGQRIWSMRLYCCCLHLSWLGLPLSILSFHMYRYTDVPTICMYVIVERCCGQEQMYFSKREI